MTTCTAKCNGTLGATASLRSRCWPVSVHLTTPAWKASISSVNSASTASGPKGQKPLQNALVRWERTKPWLRADQLIAEGVPQGPELGAALRGLRRARYLGTLSTPAEARRQVRLVLDGASDWN